MDALWYSTKNHVHIPYSHLNFASKRWLSKALPRRTVQCARRRGFIDGIAVNCHKINAWTECQFVYLSGNTHKERFIQIISMQSYSVVSLMQPINTLRPRQHGRHFADDIFKRIFVNENLWILLKISLKCVLKIRINNIPALVEIMVWRRSSDKPLSQPMLDSLRTHICVTWPQWANAWTKRPSSADIF